MRLRLAASLMLLAGTPLAAAPWPAAQESPAARVRDFPNSSAALRNALGAALQAGDREQVRVLAMRLAEMGGGLSERSRAMIFPLITPEDAATLAARFDANARPVGTSQPYLALPGEIGIAEGVAWHRGTRRLFVSTVTNRRLFAGAVPDGTIAPLTHGEDFGSLFGMALDRRRKTLWIASGVVEPTPAPESAFRGLIAFHPRHGTTIRKVAAPDGIVASPGDITVGVDGTVYASDPQNGAIYRCRKDCQRLDILVAPGVFKGPQGLVVAKGGRHLIVADYGTGLARVDIATGGISRLDGPADAMLDGIDGMARKGRDLIVIQNGTVPIRIARLRLSADGARIERATVLEQGNPEWGEPTLGFIDGDRFVYVADGGWERYGAGGVLRDGAVAHQPRIRSLSIRAAPN